MTSTEITGYTCTACGAFHSFWKGPLCTACGQAALRIGAPVPKLQAETANMPSTIGPLLPPIPTRIAPLDEVLSGGLWRSHSHLFVGGPGAGKTTLAMQALMGLGASDRGVLLSGEQSLGALKTLAKRIGAHNVPLLSTQNVEAILAFLEENGPDVCVIDSVQAVLTDEAGGGPGSYAQLRAILPKLNAFAQRSGCAMVVLSQQNAEGGVSGGQSLEHLVDTVVYVDAPEGNESPKRMLRTSKHRNGINRAAEAVLTGMGFLPAIPDETIERADLTPDRAQDSKPSFLPEGDPIAETLCRIADTLDAQEDLLREIRDLVSRTIAKTAM